MVPASDVVGSFSELVLSLDDEADEVLSNFVCYFEVTWIGVVQRGKRRRLTFEFSIGSIRQNNTRPPMDKKNSLERWHRGIEQKMARTHPTVYHLVSKLRKEHSDWS